MDEIKDKLKTLNRGDRVKLMAEIMKEATPEEIVDAIILEKLTDEVFTITKRLRQHVN